MALNWSITKIRDWNKLQGKYGPGGVVIEKPKDPLGIFLNSIILTTVCVDLDKITEKNIREWIWRIEFLNQLGKSSISQNQVFRITPGVLKRFIGLSTNATNNTRKRFIKKVVTGIERDTDWVLRKYGGLI